MTLFLVWFIGALTHSWQHFKATWLFLALALCMAAAQAYYRETPARRARQVPLVAGHWMRGNQPR